MSTSIVNKEPNTGRIQKENNTVINMADILGAVYDAVNGVLKTSIITSDIEIGAVELKDAVTDARATIDAGGSLNTLITDIVSGIATSGSKSTIVDTNKNFIINMLTGAIAEVDIGTTKYFRKVLSNTATVVTIDTIAGNPASKAIGTGVNGVVTITSINDGIGGNSYTVAAVLGDGNDISLSALLTGLNLVITLGTNVGGTIDVAKNTALLVAAIVDSLPEFTSVYNGTGADSINPFSAVTFAGGIEIIAVSSSTQYKIKSTKPPVDATGSLASVVKQSTHDNLNLNANMQVNNADNAIGNPAFAQLTASIAQIGKVDITQNLIAATKTIEIVTHLARNTAAGTEQTAVQIPKPTTPVLMYKTAMTNSSIDSALTVKLFNRRTFNIVGTAQTDSPADTTHIVLAATANPTNDHYNTFAITITAGTGIGQTRIISDYVGANTVRAEISVPWSVTPDNTSVYSIALIRDSLAWTGSFAKAVLTAPVVKANDSEIITGLFDAGCDVYYVVSNDTFIANADASRFTAVFQLSPIA